jgi:hypothetical protein
MSATSTEINNGGPAFPCETYGLRNGKETTIPTNGMTLRDYFAGQALQQFVAERDHNIWAHERFEEARKEIATAAYNIADAMLAAREVKP